MNTQDKELFELCKEVYEKTGWDYQNGAVYTSDYLLEKLVPFKTEAMGSRGDMMPVNAFVFVRRESGNEYRAGYRYNLNGSKYSNGIYADTPLKALLKLTIALHEAGELK